MKLLPRPSLFCTVLTVRSFVSKKVLDMSTGPSCFIVNVKQQKCITASSCVVWGMVEVFIVSSLPLLLGKILSSVLVHFSTRNILPVCNRHFIIYQLAKWLNQSGWFIFRLRFLKRRKFFEPIGWQYGTVRINFGRKERYASRPTYTVRNICSSRRVRYVGTLLKCVYQTYLMFRTKRSIFRVSKHRIHQKYQWCLLYSLQSSSK